MSPDVAAQALEIALKALVSVKGTLMHQRALYAYESLQRNFKRLRSHVG